MHASAQLLPSYDDALALILPHAPTLGTETIPLADAAGRVLAEDIRADRDQPPFDRSAMDGFAVKSDTVKPNVPYKIAGTIPAGGRFEGEIKPGTVLHIATGAALPSPLDAMIPIEKAQVDEKGERVVFSIAAEPYARIHPRAADAKAGDVVLPKNTTIGTAQTGIAATVGRTHLTVTVRPRVTVITSGDEVLDPATPTAALEPQQIRNSNGPLLMAFLRRLGIDNATHRHVPDDPEATLAGARKASARSHLVITTGGVSVGQRDWLPWAWKKLGLETLLHGVAIQPGKPVFVAKAKDPINHENGKPDAENGATTDENARALILGLPGNPVSVLATAHLFARPVLCAMTRRPAPTWRNVTLDTPVKSNPARQVFRAARILPPDRTPDHAPDHVADCVTDRAAVLTWQGSGDLMHTAMADGLVRLPIQDAQVTAGTSVPYLAIW